MSFIKNNIFLILLYLVIANLASCTINKKQAPIEYYSNGLKIKNEDWNKKSEENSQLIDDDDEIIFIEPGNKTTVNKSINIDSNDEEYFLETNDYKIVEHSVKKNETIEKIANDYNQSVNAIAKINNLSFPYQLEEAQTIKIRVPKDFSEPSRMDIKAKEKEEAKKAYVYLLPVKGKIISKFGEKTEYGNNKGINISAKEGTKVIASASGKIIYADYDGTFGNLVLIKLDNKNIVFSYAHLFNLIVSKGYKVNQGDVIGYVGNTGKVKQSQLYFSIREGKNALDPLKFITY